MRKRTVWAIVTVAACAALLLLVQRKAKPAMPADAAKAPAASVADRERDAIMNKPEGGTPSPSGLAAAYAPGVVVITNGVLENDTRQTVKRSSEEFKRYKLDRQQVDEQGGAKTKVTFHVVDSEGCCVAGASIGTDLRDVLGKPVAGKTMGLTDTDGLFVAEGLLQGELVYSVKKDGYYLTRTQFRFTGLGVISLKNGQNIPWNPTLRVTLKEIRKPIPMYTKQADIQLPLKNRAYGFDFLAGDLVEPDGKGRRADVLLICRGDKSYPPSLNYSNELMIAVKSGGCGFIRKRKDTWSGLKSIHEAPEAGYGQVFQLSTKRSSEKVFEKIELAEDEYLIFRTMSQGEDPAGQAHYGKIYGPIRYGITTNDREGAGVALCYYFNPTPNDRNLEFDGTNNLFKPDWRDYQWPKEP